MKKSLVIVESPSKAKTIYKFLGEDFTVKASVGHIRNLPENRLGVNVEGGFKPEYVIIKGKHKTIKEIKHAAKYSDEIFIATDPDREGEAIAWHIAQEIGHNKKILRALFNEITQNAVQHAINNPLQIDLKKVNAQQARRVLDRLVGYKVSPFLWKTLFKGSLSAGRVQSVGLKLITEREEKIRDFVKEEYWTIHALIQTPDGNNFTAKLFKHNDKKVVIPDKEKAEELKRRYVGKTFRITNITKKEVKRNPQPPFKTSTLQQESSIRLGFPPKKAMMIAQQLYEGIELGNEGSVGLITYMRTDSTRTGKEALSLLRTYIEKQFGSNYLPARPREYKSRSRGKIQDAHECIRPTYLTRTPGMVKEFLSRDQNKLYTLIWNRTLASQMNGAKYNQTSITITAGPCEFRASGSELIFPGFLTVWQDPPKSEPDNDKEDDATAIPAGIEVQMIVSLINSDLIQHFTKPPPRYTDSSLVKELEQLGIGRPSTYASIVGTLFARSYVKREQKKLFLTELGEIVNKIVIKGFPDIFNVNFTAKMESELDQIESGKKEYREVVESFYEPFQENLDKVFKDIKKFKQDIVEKAGFTCDKCDRDMVIRWSKNGKFYACSGFPECKNTMQIESNDIPEEKEISEEKPGRTCKECGRDMVNRKGKYGEFYACSGYPECKYTEQIEPPEKQAGERAGFNCQKCGSEMVTKSGRYGMFYACSSYPKCKNIVNISGKGKSTSQNAGFQCDKCGKDMVIRQGSRGKFYACSGYPECKNTIKITAKNSAPVE